MMLNGAQAQLLNQSNPSAIRDAVVRLERHWNAGAWLSPRNRYRASTVQTISKDIGNKGHVVHRQLADYIAASSVTHCFDGWCYLARALEAELAGDPNVARHLGYYAELRAAMSILAVEGIGVFNYKHIVLTAQSRCQPLSGLGTHTFAWRALEHWAGLQRSADLLFRAIRPAGIPLQDWVKGFGGSAQFVAAGWLTQWGMDLARFSDDQIARNEASYRPTGFGSSGTSGITHRVAAVTDLWKTCAPGPDGGFPIIDQHLLRRTVAVLFQSRTGRTPKQAKRKYRSDVITMLNSVNLAHTTRREMERFLTFEAPFGDPRLFENASRTDPPTHLEHSLQVLARATLLLRIATALVSTLFWDCNVGLRSGLEFWWRGNAVRRRLWTTDAPPDSFSDLWSDIGEALNDVANWFDNSTSPESEYALWTDNAWALTSLTTAERIFLWGVSS